MDKNSVIKYANELHKLMFGSKREAKRTLNNINWAMQTWKSKGYTLEQAFEFNADPLFDVIYVEKGLNKLSSSEKTEVIDCLYKHMERSLRKALGLGGAR